MSAGSAATGISSTYVVTNPKEDLEAMIYDISPMDTWCLTNFARTTVKSTLHEWQVDAQAAPVVNARLEGAEFSGTALSDTLRIKNYTQINSKDVVVSGTAEYYSGKGSSRRKFLSVPSIGSQLTLAELTFSK